MQWLTFGLAADGLLVHLDDVPPGDRGLICPYCDAGLVAEGEAFAHAAPLCPAVTRSWRSLPLLPLSGRFDADLSQGQVQALRGLSRGGGMPKAQRRALDQAGYVTWNPYRGYGGAWDLTKQGQIVVGTLSLRLFCELQAPKLRPPLAAFVQAAEWSVRIKQSPLALRVRLMDLRLYRAALRRRLLLTFALLEIHAERQIIYHSTVTERPVAELAAALRSHLAAGHPDVRVTVVEAFAHHGAIERYFAHRYTDHRTTLGSLPNCFRFDDLAAVLRDLRAMPVVELTPADGELLLGDEPPAIEHEILEILESYAEAERREALRALIQAGMRRVKALGTHVGRPKGSVEDRQAFLEKPSSQRVITALEDGLSIRNAAAAAGVSPTTVLKIKRLMDG